MKTVQLAARHPRSQIIVGGASGDPQLFLIREGRRHAIATGEWCARNQYLATDITLVEDNVILEIPVGDIIS